MLSDTDCIQACVDTYIAPQQFSIWYDGHETDQVVCGIKQYSDCTLVAFRGSSTFLDWIRDFNAQMVQTPIGGIELGFFIGLNSLACRMRDACALSGQKIYVTGHSLGGARAHIFAALLIKMGYAVEVVTFGAPRPGDKILRSILAQHPNRCYKNGPDYVTDVPIPVHPLLPYEHMSPLIPLNQPPHEGDEWGLLAWHHSDLYLTALKGI